MLFVVVLVLVTVRFVVIDLVVVEVDDASFFPGIVRVLLQLQVVRVLVFLN